MRNLLNLTVARPPPRFCETFDDAVNRQIYAIDQAIFRLTARRAVFTGLPSTAQGGAVPDPRKPG